LEGLLQNKALKGITYSKAFNGVPKRISHTFIEKDVTCKIFIAHRYIKNISCLHVACITKQAYIIRIMWFCLKVWRHLYSGILYRIVL